MSSLLPQDRDRRTEHGWYIQLLSIALQPVSPGAHRFGIFSLIHSRCLYHTLFHSRNISGSVISFLHPKYKHQPLQMHCSLSTDEITELQHDHFCDPIHAKLVERHLGITILKLCINTDSISLTSLVKRR